MKKIVFVVLLILIAINYQSCKVLKKVHRSTETLDSSISIKSETHVNTVSKDSSSDNHFQSFLNIIQSSHLSVDHLKATIEDVPESNIKLAFNIKSILLDGDTAKTKAGDGTELSVYQDKKTGKTIANLQRPGHKKQSLELDGLKLTSNKSLTKQSDSTKKTAVATVNKDTTGKINVGLHVKKANAKVDKDVKRDFGVLKWLGLALAIGVLIFIFYKLNKAKKWIKWPFGNKG